MPGNHRFQKGLLIGRFQPFHNGHLRLLLHSLDLVKQITIGIGSTNLNDTKNPLSFETRKSLIQKILTSSNLTHRVPQILALDDFPDDDDMWLANIHKKVDQVDVFITNHKWVEEVLLSRGQKVLCPPFFERDTLEGRQIRELISKSDIEWKNRVPMEIHTEIEQFMRNIQLT